MAGYPRYPHCHRTATERHDRINLHLVSDATGETLNSIARATVSQFEHAQIVYHRWSLIRTRFQLHRVLEGIEAEPGPVLSTVVDRACATISRAPASGSACLWSTCSSR